MTPRPSICRIVGANWGAADEARLNTQKRTPRRSTRSSGTWAVFVRRHDLVKRRGCGHRPPRPADCKRPDPDRSSGPPRRPRCLFISRDTGTPEISTLAEPNCRWKNQSPDRWIARRLSDVDGGCPPLGALTRAKGGTIAAIPRDYWLPPPARERYLTSAAASEDAKNQMKSAVRSSPTTC